MARLSDDAIAVLRVLSETEYSISLGSEQLTKLLDERAELLATIEKMKAEHDDYKRECTALHENDKALRRSDLETIERLRRVAHHARLVVASGEAGDVFTDDYVWVRPISPELVNVLETSIDALQPGDMGHE